MSAPVLSVAEHRREELRPVTFELLTAGRQLASACETEHHVLVIGGNEDFIDQLNRIGVDVIHTVGYDEEFNHGIYQQTIEAVDANVGTKAIVTPHSVNGLDYAPAVANAINVPIVTDVIDLSYTDGFTIARERYGSKVETVIDVDGDRALFTIRSGEWNETVEDGNAEVIPLDIEFDGSQSGSRVQSIEEVGGGGVDITDSDVLVSVGRGIEEEENLELIHNFAESLDATVSASRPIVDNGWLPQNRQVGQSGKVVTPKVYIAIGISGAVQHVAGMKGSETIIAINTDPNAPIFDIADYGIVGDLFEVIPELIKQLE